MRYLAKPGFNGKNKLRPQRHIVPNTKNRVIRNNQNTRRQRGVGNRN